MLEIKCLGIKKTKRGTLYRVCDSKGNQMVLKEKQLRFVLETGQATCVNLVYKNGVFYPKRVTNVRAVNSTPVDKNTAAQKTNNTLEESRLSMFSDNARQVIENWDKVVKSNDMIRAFCKNYHLPLEKRKLLFRTDELLPYNQSFSSEILGGMVAGVLYKPKCAPCFVVGIHFEVGRLADSDKVGFNDNDSQVVHFTLSSVFSSDTLIQDTRIEHKHTSPADAVNAIEHDFGTYIAKYSISDFTGELTLILGDWHVDYSIKGDSASSIKTLTQLVDSCVNPGLHAANASSSTIQPANASAPVTESAQTRWYSTNARQVIAHWKESIKQSDMLQTFCKNYHIDANKIHAPEELLYAQSYEAVAIAYMPAFARYPDSNGRSLYNGEFCFSAYIFFDLGELPTGEIGFGAEGTDSTEVKFYLSLCIEDDWTDYPSATSDTITLVTDIGFMDYVKSLHAKGKDLTGTLEIGTFGGCAEHHMISDKELTSITSLTQLVDALYKNKHIG